MRPVVTGSLAYDRIMRFEGRLTDHLLEDARDMLSVCYQVRSLDLRLGGAAGNIVHSMKLLGLDPVTVGCVGSDFEPYAQAMREKGLTLEGIRVMPDELTASSHILTDSASNQITGFHLGPVAHPADIEFQTAVTGSDRALSVISPGGRFDIPRYVDIARQEGIPYILDTGQTTPDHSGEELAALMDGAFLFIVNEYEMRLAERSTGLDVRTMLDLAENVVVTMGEAGSMVWTRKRETGIPAVPPRGSDGEPTAAADPTGAGDAYRAGLVGGLAMGLEMEDCARMGAVCASFAIEHSGGQEHVFTRDAFFARYRQFYGSLPG